MRIFYSLLLPLYFTLFACKQTETAQQTITESHQETTLFVTMSKTPCYGQCPVYNFNIYSNGKVEYFGKRFVKYEGNYTSLLLKEDLDSIKEQILSSNFFELNSSYDSKATDIPSCITSVTLDGQSKKIIDRTGAPKELKELEKLIENLVLNSNLTKVEE